MASPAEQSDPPERQRRIEFKDYGSWRANLLLWGLPIGVVVILLFANFSSSVATSVSGIPFQITCDGWSVDPGSGECAGWAQDVVDSGIPEGESGDPEGETPRDVIELQLQKSWYGFGDRCTAVFILRGGATEEREVPCP